MKTAIVVFLVVFFGSASAGELEVVSGSPSQIADYNVDEEPIVPLEMDGPIWEGLQYMSYDQRANSEIGLILEQNATADALQRAEEIEKRWNNGQYEQAIQLFGGLADLTDIDEVSIGNRWRNPLQTIEQPDWDTDVRIGNRDSIYVNAFDIHNATGNLFAILLFQGDGFTATWAVNLSTDGGATWSETYAWWAGYHINHLSATVVSNHCYVAFSRGSFQDQAFLYRFNANDGQQENFGNGSSYITVFTTTSPESILEVAITSNQDVTNDRLYYFGLTSEGVIRYCWDTPDALSWAEIFTGVSDADRGLDASFNEGFSQYFLNVSYIGDDNYLNIMGRGSGPLTSVESGLVDADR
ncbi:MAG: hypothetical protein JSW64_02195 [Candidatus Zixiibacteriota bacterium]|nr:MAG: hypothetical protein JSW64_02195 [candidate division Zixibacteria bacterium]